MEFALWIIAIMMMIVMWDVVVLLLAVALGLAFIAGAIALIVAYPQILAILVVLGAVYALADMVHYFGHEEREKRKQQL